MEEEEEPVILVSMDLVMYMTTQIQVEVVIGHCQVVFVDIVTVIILKF